MTILLLAHAVQWTQSVHTSARSLAHFKALEGMEPRRIEVDTGLTCNGMHPVIWSYEVHMVFSDFAKKLAADFGGSVYGLYQMQEKRLPGVRTSLVVEDGVLRSSNSKQPPIRTLEGEWLTVVVEDYPDLLQRPSRWPKEASNARIVNPHPPLKLVGDQVPVSESRWFSQSGSGVDYTYLFKQQPDALANRLNREMKKPWLPSPGPQTQFRIWEPHAGHPGNRKPDIWTWWAVGVSPVEGEPTMARLTVTRGQSMNPPSQMNPRSR
ncbi:MAG: hypothetical protein ACHQ50_00985 [Fimbriimonadales bacterium]